MAQVLEAFSPPTRKTKYPYAQWFCGKIMELKPGSDFYIEPRAMATTLRTYAKRHGFAAVVVVVAGNGERRDHIELWGDPARPEAEGLPDDIAAQVSRRVRRGG